MLIGPAPFILLELFDGSTYEVADQITHIYGINAYITALSTKGILSCSILFALIDHAGQESFFLQLVKIPLLMTVISLFLACFWALFISNYDKTFSLKIFSFKRCVSYQQTIELLFC